MSSSSSVSEVSDTATLYTSQASFSPGRLRRFMSLSRSKAFFFLSASAVCFCILQLRGLPPFFSPKYDLKRHPNYRYTAEADKQKNAFDLDRLINRRRRPGLNEVCTMYEVAVPDDALTEEDEDILNYDDIDDPDAFA